MLTNSELRARLARVAPVRDVGPARSSSSGVPVTLMLRRTAPLDRPVDLARLLVAHGLSMRAAHTALNRLAESGWAIVSIPDAAGLRDLSSALAGFGIQARHRRTAEGDGAAIAAVRTRHGLSQREFADLLGIDVRTLQNWEQGRNRPDPAAISLVRVFEHAPQVVEEAVSEPLPG